MRIVWNILSLLILLPFSLQGQEYTFVEDFSDNNNYWNLGEKEEHSSKIENDKYIIEHSDSVGANLFWNHNIDIDYDSEFEINTQLKQLSGNKLYGYGLVWGGLDGANFYAYTISCRGFVNIYKFEDGEYIDLLPWTAKQDLIKGVGENNNLQIQRSEDQLFFLLNGSLVYSMDYQENFGNKIGYVINTDMKLSVDWLKIKDHEKEDFSNVEQPEIVWVYPKSELSTVSDQYMDVEAGIIAHNHLNTVKFYINGRLVTTTDYKAHARGEDLEVIMFDEIITEHIRLNTGINILKIILEDYDGHTIISKRIVKSKFDYGHSNRKDYALFFATDAYDTWSDLSNPVNDAKTISEQLKVRYGFETEIVENANREGVLAKLYEYNTKKYDEYDQLLIFFAGHGKYDAAVGMGYIVCQDSKKIDLGNSSYVGFSDLQTFINNSKCEHICLMMDVCFGGTFDQTVLRGEPTDDDPIYQEISKNEFITRKLKSKTRKYVSSGEHFVPDGLPGSHSPFARKVIEGLHSQGGDDGILTYSEMLHFMERIKPQPLYGGFGSDEPGSEFLFIVK